LKRFLALLLVGIFVFEVPAAQCVAMQGTPTILSIRRVKSTPGSFSFNYPINSFQRDYLVDIAGSLETPGSIELGASPANGLLFIFTVYKENRIVKTAQSQVTVYESAHSAYWTASFWVTVPLPDAYAGLDVVAYFAGSGSLSPSTAQALLSFDIDTVQFTDFPSLYVNASLPPILTRLTILATSVTPYESMFYVAVKGTFTANYSTPCLNRPWSPSCDSPSEPDAPALPNGLTIHLTVTDGKQIVQTIDIVTNGLLFWSTQFWLPKPLTAYYLIAIFNGVQGEFSPTLTQVQLQV
jgi:hypothetical protein